MWVMVCAGMWAGEKIGLLKGRGLSLLLFIVWFFMLFFALFVGLLFCFGYCLFVCCLVALVLLMVWVRGCGIIYMLCWVLGWGIINIGLLSTNLYIYILVTFTHHLPGPSTDAVMITGWKGRRKRNPPRRLARATSSAWEAMVMAMLKTILTILYLVQVLPNGTVRAVNV